MEQASTTETGACERCGVETDIRIDDRWLCAECYAISGSCCAEFGADDLTAEADSKE